MARLFGRRFASARAWSALFQLSQLTIDHVLKKYGPAMALVGINDLAHIHTEKFDFRAG
jgi:hypothetical protein